MARRNCWSMADGFEHVEKLKQEYTDKYVVVDESAPELRRFRGMTGTVRTVNMSGRALVEFDAYNNIGWYDIDIDFLKVVDRPVEPEEPVAKKKPAGAKAEKAPSDLEKARSEKGGKSGGGKMSVADMLAAARGKASAGEPAAKKEEPQEKAAPAKMSVADMLAAARANKPKDEDSPAKAEATTAAEAKTDPAPKKEAPAKAPAAKADPSKMSVSDILAAARGKQAAPAAEESAPEPEEESVEESADETEVVAEETPEPEEQPTETPSTSSDDGEVKSMRDQITDVAEMIAYCRQQGGA